MMNPNSDNVSNNQAPKMQKTSLIKPLGSYFKQTANGHIINPTSATLIPTKWRPLIAEVQTTIIEKFGTDLYSIYLRGSVSRGQAIDAFSDLDIFVLLRQEDLRWKPADWLPEFQEKWKSAFTFVKDIEVMCSSFSENIYTSKPAVAMIIKTQSLLLFGPDISETIPDFKPSKEMMINYRWLRKDLEAFFAKANPQSNDIQEITKVLIRSGFEIVMERLGKYTNDLYPAYQAFAQYYPERATQMKSILHYYLNPDDNLKVLYPVLRDLGAWLLQEIQERI